MINGFDDAISTLDFNSKTLADLGCGFGRWAHLIRSEVDKHGHNAYIVGCDIHRPYLEETRKYNPYDDLVVCDVRNLPFRKKSFDVTIALEVIEHVTKQEGVTLLSNLENLTRDIVIVSTPYGYYPQGKERNNIYEIHRSAWHPEDFQEKGYKTFNCGLGNDLENLAHKLRIFNILHKLLKSRYGSRWTGIMVFAVKKNSRRT